MEVAMAKKMKKNDPKVIAKRELARKKARKKRLTILVIVVVALLIIALAVFLIVNAAQAGIETYTDGAQTIRLYSDGSFSADLPHGVRRSGTHFTANVGGLSTITFIYDGEMTHSEFIDGQLLIPVEWQDSCGHNTILSRR
jgi:uncharacterized protein (UPF0333 family)